MKCNNNLSNCFCEKEKGHKGFHKCRCEGTWDNDGNPKSLPNILDYGFNALPNTEEELKILKNKSN